MKKSPGSAAGQGVVTNQCYSHLGGRLGRVLLEHIVREGWLESVEGKRFRLTDEGRRGLKAWGIDPKTVETEGPR